MSGCADFSKCLEDPGVARLAQRGTVIISGVLCFRSLAYDTKRGSRMPSRPAVRLCGVPTKIVFRGSFGEGADSV